MIHKPTVKVGWIRVLLTSLFPILFLLRHQQPLSDGGMSELTQKKGSFVHREKLSAGDKICVRKLHGYSQDCRFHHP